MHTPLDKILTRHFYTVNHYYEMTEQKLKEYAVGNDGAEAENE